MKYRIVLTLYIVLVQGQVNRNFRLVLNEMGHVGHGISTALFLSILSLMESYMQSDTI